jgi:hypothetical protein
MNAVEMMIEVLGWLGAALLIGAYAMVSYGPTNANRRLYQSLNIAAALLLAVNTAWHRAWPSTALNVIWMIIAAGTLIPGASRHHKRQIPGA